MSAPFAPAPWAMKIEPERYPESDDADLPAVVRDANGKVVVYLPESYGPNMAPFYQANARLIAAAPRLLDQHDSNLVDLAMLRRAIVEGDPKPELLIRVDDIVRRTKEAMAMAVSA